MGGLVALVGNFGFFTLEDAPGLRPKKDEKGSVSYTHLDVYKRQVSE